MTTTYTHKVQGYTYWASIYCHDCGHDLPDIDPEGNSKHPFYSWDEVYGNCDTCNLGFGQYPDYELE
jgi:hypothetical protein